MRFRLPARSRLMAELLLAHQGYHYAIFPSVGGRQFEADNIDQMGGRAALAGRCIEDGAKRPFTLRPDIGLAIF